MDDSEVNPITTITISALTDTGMVRDHNEDNFIVCPDLSQQNWLLVDKPVSLSSKGCLLVVADGMGGTNAGEVASAIAVESLKNYFSTTEIPDDISEGKVKDLLKEAILKAHWEIVNHAKENPSCAGMGTTIITAWIIADKVILGWCGDSRGYIYSHRKELKSISKDHSLVWELVEAGQLTAEEADFHPNNNIITQSLGDSLNPPVPDFMVETLEPGDKIILCSDGLNNMLSSEEISSILFQEKALFEINKDLIEAANQKGGRDNITSILVEVGAVAPENNKRITVEKTPLFRLGIWLALIVSTILILVITKQLEKRSKVIPVGDTEQSATPAKINSPVLVEKIAESGSKDGSTQRGEIKKAAAQPVLVKRDTIVDAFEQRVKKVETILLEWDKISITIDSLRENQTRDAEISNTKHFFQLITLQDQLEEISSENKFQILLSDWEFQQNKSELLTEKYDLKNLDQAIAMANEKLTEMHAILSQVLSESKV